MALFIRQTEDRSRLQERLNAQLQERHKQTGIGKDAPETIEDSAYLKDTKDASSLTWLWVLVALAAAGVIAYLIYLGIH